MSDGNVRVAVRVRPLCARERLAGSNEVISLGNDGVSVIAAPDRQFTFDSVFGADIGQDVVFGELAKPLVEYFVDGFNCTILAYGQTGSGKTFTMGTGLEGLDELTVGIIPRAVQQLVGRLEQVFNGASGTAESGEFFELYVSFLELYNEEIVDLLSSQDRLDRNKRAVLTIREDTSGAICIAGIKEEKIGCGEDIMECLQKGTLGRTTKSTDMNLVSSRSHAVFTITLRQRRMVSDEMGVLTLKNFVSKLHFVDLAGSERLKRTGVVGDRAKESISINSGLLALGNVISALGDETRKTTHVPYRDSKLTRLLQDSLGGNSRTVMIACISPSSDNYSETVNTLKYANRARNIKNTAQINEDSAGNAAFEIMQLKKQVAALKTEILQLRGLGMRRAVESTPRKSTNVDTDELTRLRAHNRDLQRKFDIMQREKINAEAERDFYKSAASSKLKDGESPSRQVSIIKDHLRTISELHNRISEMEQKARDTGNTTVRKRIGSTGPARTGPAGIGSAGAGSTRSTGIGAPPSPGLNTNEPPGWFNKANALIDRTKHELQENATIMTELQHNAMDDLLKEDTAPSSGNREAFAAAVISRTEVLMGQMRNDLNLKEELIVQIENSQQEFLAMRRKYDERLRLLRENVSVVQRERDEALKVVSAPKEDSRSMRLKYEEKIKKMGREVNDLKSKISDLNRDSGNKISTNDQLVRNLRSAVQTAKTEKARLQSRVDELTGRLREDSAEFEMKELRLRERKASEQARKYKKAYDFQKTLLQKRVEQYLQTKNRVRMLLVQLRRHRVPLSPSMGNLLDSPSWRRHPSPNTLETPISKSRSSSGLASKAISAADLTEMNGAYLTETNETEFGRLSLDPKGMSVDGFPSDDPEYITSPALTNPMETPSAKSRRSSLIQHGQPLLVPPGSEVPRSVLRMSPLLPRRTDMFARIADAASLSLASHHLQQLQNWSASTSGTPSRSNSRDIIQPTSPMKIDDDVVEFYRSSPVD